MNGLFLCASDISVGSAALYALVGFIIVLVVLALLVGIFYLSGFLFQTKALSRDKLFERKPKTQEVVEPELIPDIEAADSEEEVAAITAAIALILQSESDGDVKPDFVIHRIVRK